jgi:uncharacterized membrane protein
VEIAYILVSSAALPAVLAGAYEFLLVRVGAGAHAVLGPTGRLGAVLMIALLTVRAVRLLRRLETGLGSGAEDQPGR